MYFVLTETGGKHWAFSDSFVLFLFRNDCLFRSTFLYRVFRFNMDPCGILSAGLSVSNCRKEPQGSLLGFSTTTGHGMKF